MTREVMNEREEDQGAGAGEEEGRKEGDRKAGMAAYQEVLRQESLSVCLLSVLQQTNRNRFCDYLRLRYFLRRVVSGLFEQL